MATKRTGYLGIDAGTQGLSAIFCDEDLRVLAVGEGDYEMLAGLDEGCYEQSPDDWERALVKACQQLQAKLAQQDVEMEVTAIGVSGQMHGEVLADADGKSLGPARLWCDARNQEEGDQLTETLGVKMPKRITSARWLWTTRNRPEIAKQAAYLTTPSGWISYRLTGNWNLGIGDAAGMFPIDGETFGYDHAKLQNFESICGDQFPKIRDLLPEVKLAGQTAGNLNADGAALLGLPEGISVAPAEGDQPAALAGSLIGDAGMVSVSFGTSVCANSVGDRPFSGVSQAVDHFCAPDGKPINMVWLRNGTTFMNSLVEMYGSMSLDENAFQKVMPQVLSAANDCGGILTFPFMDDEPGLGVHQGSQASVIGLNSANVTPGNIVKAALLSTMFNLKMGSEILDEQGYPRQEMILSGGLTKTPEFGQILADVFCVPVRLLESSDEGTAWGAVVMAKFQSLCAASKMSPPDWSEFLQSLNKNQATRFEPDRSNSQVYEQMYQRYRELLPRCVSIS